MTAEERRNGILETIRRGDGPHNATVLAKTFGVSRQVVVTDVALLRASGHEINATPRGYVMGREENGLIRRVACRHCAEDAQQELNIIVDNGCTVLDVVVEHPLYGELTGALRLKNRYEVSAFLSDLSHARPLSILTEGVHLHTISCPDVRAYERVVEQLSEKGILLKE